MEQTAIKIADAAEKLMKRLPAGLKGQVLLTGGSAAYLYGSDRPFSDDIDFLVPANRVSYFEKTLNIHFSRHAGKPVFHSLKAVFKGDGLTFDLIALSFIQPTGHSHSYRIYLTTEILKRKQKIRAGGKALNLVPLELLVLIKLLAGRGKELNKYDLYDVSKLMEKTPEFDFGFFEKLILKFCRPLKQSLPVLISHAKKAGHARILAVLKSLQPSS